MAGLKIGAPIWRLIIHDWSKLTPQEWPAYANMFYGKNSKANPPPHLQKDFDAAWLHHQRVNKHHWQYWILVQDTGAVKTVEMPEKYVLEMVADWAGAGKAITGTWADMPAWYEKHKKNMTMHPNTRFFAEMIIRHFKTLTQ